MTRFGRTRDVEAAHQATKLILVLFDMLLLDEHHLADEPYIVRRKRLEETVPAELVMERLVTRDPASATKFFPSCM